MGKKQSSDSTVKKGICVQCVESHSPMLNKVKNLWRANRQTLGFFPDGAFNEHAAQKHILIAINDKSDLLGYLAYRVSKGDAVIVHLCVNPNYRKTGVAHILAEDLKQRTKVLNGIRLRCRRDYEASHIWPRLGFIAIDELPGRSKKRDLLTLWRFDHGHPTLFSQLASKNEDERMAAVIDANVFYDLGQLNDEDALESQAITADWLEEYLILCVTDELLNEIDRCEDPRARKRHRASLQEFTILESNRHDQKAFHEQLLPHFRGKTKVSDESDIRHLAKAIAAHASIFITRDGALLAQSDDIYEKFNIRITRPCDLITKLDELRRERDYQPVRLRGCRIEKSLVASGHIERLAKIFQLSNLGEKKSRVQRTLRKALANPEIFTVEEIKDSQDRQLALIIYDRQKPDVLSVPLFRITKSSISTTLARDLARELIDIAVVEKRSAIKVTDETLSIELRSALSESFFSEVGKHWAKLCISAVIKHEDLGENLTRMSMDFPDFQPLIAPLTEKMTNTESFPTEFNSQLIEKLFFPIKISNALTPSFIIPIRPPWAMQLFDSPLANGTLFGPDIPTHLRTENVYYCAKNSTVASVPGRILWYVTNSKKFSGCKSMRACSVLEECIIGKPKDLYSKFRRLGIYEWHNVFNTAKRNLDKEIMALRFSRTEIFSQAIPWHTLQQILLEEQRRSAPIQSPTKINEKTFMRIYSMAMNKEDTQ